MLALDQYEQSTICPLCGMDTGICHDEQAVRQLWAGAGVEICYISELRERAMKQYAESGIVEYRQSQTTRLIPRQ